MLNSWEVPMVVVGTAIGLVEIFRPAWLWKTWLGAPAQREELTEATKGKMKDQGMIFLGASACIADTENMLGRWGLYLLVAIAGIWVIQKLRNSN